MAARATRLSFRSRRSGSSASRGTRFVSSRIKGSDAAASRIELEETGVSRELWSDERCGWECEWDVIVVDVEMEVVGWLRRRGDVLSKPESTIMVSLLSLTVYIVVRR